MNRSAFKSLAGKALLALAIPALLSSSYNAYARPSKKLPKSKKSEKYAATVSDGTPLTMRADYSIDEEPLEEANLESLKAADIADTSDESLDKEQPSEQASNEQEPTLEPEVAPKKKPMVHKNVAQVKIAQASTSANSSVPEFDIVPKEKIAEIAERIKYANDILRKTGKAYDYRTTTLKQFKQIRKQLEAKNDK